MAYSWCCQGYWFKLCSTQIKLDNGRVMQQYTGFGFGFEVYVGFKASLSVEQKPCYECLGVLRPRYHSKQFPDGAVR